MAKNTPKVIPYACEEDLAKMDAKHLSNGSGAFDRFKKVAEQVINTPPDEFKEQCRREQNSAS
jgi:hypothetical protein